MALKRIVPETLANLTFIGNQVDPDVAGLLSGGYVVAWEGLDGSGNGVFAHLFGANYRPTGFDLPLNGTVAGDQGDVVLAGLSGGGFVALWEGPDGNQNGVHGRRFTAAGTPLGGDFQVNQFVAGDQDEVRVAPLPANGFVAVWESENQDFNGYGVYMRRFLDGGVPAADEIRVNSFTGGDQDDPDVAAFADGRFVVGWESDGQVSATSGTDIFAQLYAATGIRIGPEFRVNTTTAGSQDGIAVETLANGRFVFVWESADQDGSEDGIFGRLYDAGGAPLTGEFQVNTFVAGHQAAPRVASLADGGFLVTWDSAAQDGSGRGVYAQAYDADGTREGIEFRINVHTTNDQDSPAVARLNGTGIAVVWESDDQIASEDVIAQTHAEPLPVWRFYNNANGVHFFTISTAERDNVIATLPSFRFEGSGFQAANGPFEDTGTVFRFYNTQNGAHFYTIDAAERDNILATLPWFNYEGSSYHAYTDAVAGTVPLYRFYNSVTGAHFFTATEGERDAVIAGLPTFRFEGIAYYVDPMA